MRWIDTIVQDVRPAFGGIATFCVDPDHLLEMPETREAIRAADMEIHEWDSQAQSLAAFRDLPPTARPLVVVDNDSKRHIVEANLPDHAWVTVAITSLMPKFPRDIVRSIPTPKWDTLLAVHDDVRSPRSAHEAAMLVARAVYGMDVQYLRHDNGWVGLLARIAVNGDDVPDEVAKAICEEATPPAWLAGASAAEAIADPTTAREVVLRRTTDSPAMLDTMPLSDMVLVDHLRRDHSRCADHPTLSDVLAGWDECHGSAAAILAFAVRYGLARAAGSVSNEQWKHLDTQFGEWVHSSYGLMQSSPNEEVLRTSRLLEHIDSEVGSGRLLLVVVDALSLQAWPRVEAQWRAQGAIGGAVTRAAFTVLPTITSLARRALFEGKPPSQFGTEKHSQRLERRLWAERYGGTGEYYVTEEVTGLRDALALGRERLCLMDLSWDRRGHAIDPRVDSVAEAARVWADRTPIAGTIRTALETGYRVFVTSDHGQVECRGIGRPNVGDLPSGKGKRVLLFGDRSVSESYASDSTVAFRPMGLPASVYPLFALGSASFDLSGAETVSHGGMSLDEVIVPVAEVTA